MLQRQIVCRCFSGVPCNRLRENERKMPRPNGPNNHFPAQKQSSKAFLSISSSFPIVLSLLRGLLMNSRRICILHLHLHINLIPFSSIDHVVGQSDSREFYFSRSCVYRNFEWNRVWVGPSAPATAFLYLLAPLYPALDLARMMYVSTYLPYQKNESQAVSDER